MYLIVVHLFFLSCVSYVRYHVVLTVLVGGRVAWAEVVYVKVQVPVCRRLCGYCCSHLCTLYTYFYVYVHVIIMYRPYIDVLYVGRQLLTSCCVCFPCALWYVLRFLERSGVSCGMALSFLCYGISIVR